jgi:hypothetical protein
MTLWNHDGALVASLSNMEGEMWILEWGDAANQATGQWNHEEHDSSAKALDAAKTKIGMRLLAHAIRSPVGKIWMSRDQLLDSIKVNKETSNP